MREGTEFSFMRFSLALVLMTLTGTTIYTLVDYGLPIVVPYLMGVLAIASVLAVFVFIPIIAVCFKMQRVKISWIAPLVFLAISVLIACWNLYAYSEAETIFEQGKALVAEGGITSEGYLKILRDAVITGLISVFGSVVFWIIAIRHRWPQKG